MPPHHNSHEYVLLKRVELAASSSLAADSSSLAGSASSFSSEGVAGNQSGGTVRGPIVLESDGLLGEPRSSHEYVLLKRVELAASSSLAVERRSALADPKLSMLSPDASQLNV